jgi:Putative phage serine protease XkdF
MKLFELILEDETDEVMALSLVANPAIEANWVYFSKEGKTEVKFATVDEDKRTIVAPVLIPDKKILRIDENTGEEYNVYLSAETIEKAAQRFLQRGYQHKATLEHGENIDGEVSVVESWVSKSSTKDKSSLYFSRAFPVGTWFVTFKVNDEDLWQNYVKTGVVKAVSIEGIFGHSLVHAEKSVSMWDKSVEDLTEEEADIFLSKIKAVFETYSDYGTDIKSNAKRGIELNEKNGNKCATQTGKVRAQQLANGEPISVETIKRMYSYLSRAEVYYDETDTSACGTISYLLWGGKSALSWSRNKLDELGLLEAEAQPSVTSTYPGEAAEGKKKYKSPATFAECPEATQNIEVNLKNRQNCIDTANYGPLNPNEPNEDYWKAKADMFKGEVESAKKALCGNCAFFIQTKQMLDCIASGIGGDVKDEWDTIKAGDLGYCEAFDFKCAANRTCDAWVVGGPVTDLKNIK